MEPYINIYMWNNLYKLAEQFQESCDANENKWSKSHVIVVPNKRQTTSLVDSVPSTARPRGSMDLLSWTSRRGHGSRTVPWTCDGTREKKKKSKLREGDDNDV